MRSPSLVLIATALAGCLEFGKVDDAKVPGDLLGMYAVTGELEETTCGEGALGASDQWQFEVKLSRTEQDLYWHNGREAIVGSIGPDGRSFAFQTRIEVEAVPASRGRAACRVARDDSASGRLSATGPDVESFDGSLEFRFRALQGTDCALWLGSEGAPATLPCAMKYALSAERQDD